MNFLQGSQRKIVANRIVYSTIQTQMKLDSQETLTSLLEFIKPVLEGNVENPSDYQFEDE